MEEAVKDDRIDKNKCRPTSFMYVKLEFHSCLSRKTCTYAVCHGEFRLLN